MENQFPMKPGEVLKTNNTGSLTAFELKELRRIGWKEGDPMPSQVEALSKLAAAEAERQLTEAELQPMSQTGQTTVDLNALPPDIKARVMQAIASGSTEPSISLVEAAKFGNVTAPPAKLPASIEARLPVSFNPLPQSVNPSNYPKDYVPPQETRRTGLLDRQVEIVNDIEPTVEEPPVATPTPVKEAKQPVPAEPVAEPAPADEPMTTGADIKLTNCPHCNWDLSVPSIPEPSKEDKHAFLQCVLGMKLFSKTYEMLGGKATVTFRSLTLPEIDLIYSQINNDYRAKLIRSENDYHEKINRYRLCLQVHKLDCDIVTGFARTLPDGYSSKTNPHATETWDETSTVNTTKLPEIVEKFATEILPSESLQRMVTLLCNQFNRLVAKLEVMVDNPDFWNETE